MLSLLFIVKTIEFGILAHSINLSSHKYLTGMV